MSHSEANRVRIFDTTLRDGEQSPGASMTLEEKLQIARVLEAMRVDVIEAGFAIASPPLVISTGQARRSSPPTVAVSIPSLPPARCI